MATRSDNKLLITCGLPGSGKSTWAKRESNHTVIICPDEFRHVLTGQWHCPFIEDIVWSTVKTCTKVFLEHQHKDVLIDATHITRWSRAQWIKLAQSYSVGIICYYFPVSINQCLENNQKRERRVPEEVIYDMDKRFEPPDIKEGFSQVITPTSFPEGGWYGLSF